MTQTGIEAGCLFPKLICFRYASGFALLRRDKSAVSGGFPEAGCFGSLCTRRERLNDIVEIIFPREQAQRCAVMPMKSMTDKFPWRVFWWLLVAGVIGASASLPYLSEQFFTNPEVRQAMPPLSLPMFEVLVVAQSAIYLALIIPLGLLLTRRIGFEFPLVRAWASGARAPAAGRVLAMGLLSGMAVGALALALEMVVFFPHLPPPLQALDAGSIPVWKRLLVGLFYGGIVEELFFRFFLLSLFVWLFGFVWRPTEWASVGRGILDGESAGSFVVCAWASPGNKRGRAIDGAVGHACFGAERPRGHPLRLVVLASRA